MYIDKMSAVNILCNGKSDVHSAVLNQFVLSVPVAFFLTSGVYVIFCMVR